MENNQDKLLQELKKRIAISNFEKENLEENQNIFPTNFLEDWRKCVMKKKVLNVASILSVIIILVGASTGIYAKMQWDIGFKEYQNREYETGLATVKDANESGYTENIEMDYIVQDGIGVKLTSLLMTDEYVEIAADFQFPENMEVNTETFSYGFAVYDNEKKVYSVSSRRNVTSPEKFDTYTPYIYKEIGVKYNRFNLYDILLNDVCGTHNVFAENHHIISKIELGSSKGFPKSKKLFVRINKLGYTMIELSENPNVSNYMEDFEISDAEWIFEIEVPEKFYERTIMELTLKDEIPNFEIEKIEVSEVYLMIRGTLGGFEEKLFEESFPLQVTHLTNKTIYITDENGNVYNDNTSGVVGNGDWFRKCFEITKDMLNKKFFLNVVQDGKVYTSELIEK